jgi:hypothetical protein
MAGSNCARIRRNAVAESATLVMASAPTTYRLLATPIPGSWNARGPTAASSNSTSPAPTTHADMRPTPAVTMLTPKSTSALRQSNSPVGRADASQIATGAAMSALRCSGTARASK